MFGVVEYAAGMVPDKDLETKCLLLDIRIFRSISNGVNGEPLWFVSKNGMMYGHLYFPSPYAAFKHYLER